MTDIYISVQEADFNIEAECTALRSRAVGAISLFVGTVRDASDELISLTLEHYPQMTEAEIKGIAKQACAKWSLEGVRIIHRIGRLLPEENIVLVAASSQHRQASLDAVHFIMDYLKTDAPFWKAEETKDGVHWVEARAADDKAKDKWQR